MRGSRWLADMFGESGAIAYWQFVANLTHSIRMVAIEPTRLACLNYFCNRMLFKLGGFYCFGLA